MIEDISWKPSSKGEISDINRLKRREVNKGKALTFRRVQRRWWHAEAQVGDDAALLLDVLAEEAADDSEVRLLPGPPLLPPHRGIHVFLSTPPKLHFKGLPFFPLFSSIGW